MNHRFVAAFRRHPGNGPASGGHHHDGIQQRIEPIGNIGPRHHRPHRMQQQTPAGIPGDEASRGETSAPQQLPQEAVFAARQEALAMHLSEAVEQYMVQLVIATRAPQIYSQELAGWIEKAPPSSAARSCIDSRPMPVV